ncbi:MAG: DUF2924 domain-containing protein [Planctomycetes bacterium]|nr:DUF2924 domain-containing protein [Planctomycetota bacterium]
MAKSKKQAESGVVAELAALQGMGQPELKAKFKEVVGEEPRSHNKPYLIRRIAFTLQREGKGRKAMKGQGEAAAPATAPATDAPSAVQPAEQQGSKGRDPRLPAIGSIISKNYKDREIKVLVTEDGFEMDGERFRSLSAIAKKLMGGTSVNGFLFFGLLKQEKGK